MGKPITKSLWMPQSFVYFNNEYYKVWQAFKREQDSIDPSWDVDWDKAEEEDKKKEAKEQARNDRKRKQELEERAASKEANGHGLSATFISSPAAITCVYQAFDVRYELLDKLLEAT